MAAVLTAKGRDITTARIKGTGTEPLNVGWGGGGVAGGPFTAATTDVGPFNELAEVRTAGTSSQVTTTTANDTYQVVGTITATGARTVCEVFLSDSSTKPFSTTVASGAVIGSNSATTFTSGASYTPANNTYIQIRTEVLKVTAGTGTTSLTVTRAQNGSAAISTIAASDAVTGGNIPGGTGDQTGGALFVHADHGSSTLATNDSITYTVQCKFT